MVQLVNLFELLKHGYQSQKSYRYERSEETNTNRAIKILYGWLLKVKNFANANIKNNIIFKEALYKY